MSFRTFFSMPLTEEEEVLIASYFLLKRTPVGRFVDAELSIKCKHILELLHELPEECSSQLALTILEGNS